MRGAAVFPRAMIFMNRGLTEAKKIYEMLSDVNSELDGYCGDIFVAAAVKRIFMLASIIYPEYMAGKEKGVLYLADKWVLMEGKWPVEDSGEIIYQYSACNSDICDYLLCYLKNSPFWDISFDNLSYNCYEEDRNNEAEFVRIHRGCFESKLLESYHGKEPDIHPLGKFFGLFKKEEGESADDVVVLASRLLPFYKKVREKAQMVDKAICLLIETAERKLTHWLNGFSYAICESDLEKCYYISCDASSDCFRDCYGAGVLDAELEILMVGEIIDKGILELDAKMCFLPTEIRNLAVAE